MNTTTSEDFENAIAELAIRRKLMIYARGIDRLDPELVRSAFHPDAVLVYGQEGSVDSFVDNMAQGGLSTYSFTQHFIGNVIIDVSGDKARSEAYCLARHRNPAQGEKPESDFLWGGRYVDQFEKRNGEWAITHRICVHDYTRFDDVGEKWEGAAIFTQGQHGETDIVFANSNQ